MTKRVHIVTFLGALLVCIVAVLGTTGPYLLSLFLGGGLTFIFAWIPLQATSPASLAGIIYLCE